MSDAEHGRNRENGLADILAQAHELSENLRVVTSVENEGHWAIRGGER